MAEVAIALAAVVVLALVGVAVVGLTFRAARAVRAAQSRTPDQWVRDALPGATIRALGGQQFEAETEVDGLRLRLTWTDDSFRLQGWCGAREASVERAAPPGRELRAAVGSFRRRLMEP